MDLNLSSDDVIRLEITLNNNLDSEIKNQRISDLEKELEKLRLELRQFQSLQNDYALTRLRLSRAISAIKRLGGDPAVFGL